MRPGRDEANVTIETRKRSWRKQYDNDATALLPELASSSQKSDYVARRRVKLQSFVPDCDIALLPLHQPPVLPGVYVAREKVLTSRDRRELTRRRLRSMAIARPPWCRRTRTIDETNAGAECEQATP